MSDPRSFAGVVDVRLLATYSRGRRNVQFLTELIYTDEVRGIEARIAPGSVTDWTSAPRWAWSVIPSFDMAAEASALHDSLLTLRRLIENGLPVSISRKTIDRLYREALRPLGVPQWRRNVHWLGVRFQAWATGDR